MTQPKYCCPRCGKIIKKSNHDSKPKNGEFTFYCLANDFHNWNIRIELVKRISIRSGDNPNSIERQMRKMRCIYDGELLNFSKKGSYQRKKKITASCWKGHRIDYKILSKISQLEPMYREIIQVVILFSYLKD